MPTRHFTLIFNNNMSTAALFLDIEESFFIIWHHGLLYKLSEIKFSISLIKLICSVLSQRKYRVSVEGEISTPRDIQTGVSQGSVLSPTLYNTYIKDTPQTPGVYLGLFASDTCIYVADCNEGCVLRKLQRRLQFLGVVFWIMASCSPIAKFIAYLNNSY
jgi:hypothetical protein